MNPASINPASMNSYSNIIVWQGTCYFNCWMDDKNEFTSHYWRNQQAKLCDDINAAHESQIENREQYYPTSRLQLWCGINIQ